MIEEIEDPAGVFDNYSEEQIEKLKENMYELRDAPTKWIGDQLRWTCPECGHQTMHDKRYSTIRCEECMCILQAEAWSVGDDDPGAPEPVQEESEPKEEEVKQQPALSW